MNTKSIRLCFIGNMLGRNAGYISTQGQILADLFAADGYEVACVSSKINRAARLAEIVETLFKNRRNFDVVILDTYSGLSFITADVIGRLCRFFRLPLIMVLRGGSLPEFGRKYSRWTKSVFNRANLLVAPSRFLAEKIGSYGCNIRIIANVVDIDRYPFRERKAASPHLIWMRSFHPIYNPAMAIQVLARLRRIEPTASLTMAGADKGLEPEIKSLAQESGLTEAIKFAGFLNADTKTREFSAADIYINTNRIDNMPVSIIEALAFGLPVVATNVGGVPYLIEHGETGLLVADDDADQMAESITKLLQNPELTKKISNNGRRLAERSSWQNVRREWEDVFEELMREKRK